MLFRRKSNGHTPHIDTEICIGCERCVDRCHGDALRMRYTDDWGYANLLYPEKCTGCGRCAEGCIEQAIEMVPAYGANIFT